MTARTVLATVKRFGELGSVHDRHRSSRRRSVRIVETIERVRASVAANPLLSTRKCACVLNISRTSLMRIQRADLQLRPYKIQQVHHITTDDIASRNAFCVRFLHVLQRDPSVAHRLIMGNEANFELTGAVFNHQNVRFWGTENPHVWLPRKRQGAERVTVW